MDPQHTVPEQPIAIVQGVIMTKPLGRSGISELINQGIDRRYSKLMPSNFSPHGYHNY
jgi:hypothetical protein